MTKHYTVSPVFTLLTLRIDRGSRYLLYKVIRPVWVFSGIFFHSFQFQNSHIHSAVNKCITSLLICGYYLCIFLHVLFFFFFFSPSRFRFILSYVLVTRQSKAIYVNLTRCSDTFFLSSQGRINQLEEDLNDERGSADRLMERLDKTKTQAGLLSHCLCFSSTQTLILCLVMFIHFPDGEEIKLFPVINSNTQPYICCHHKQI